MPPCVLCCTWRHRTPDPPGVKDRHRRNDPYLHEFSGYRVLTIPGTSSMVLVIRHRYPHAPIGASEIEGRTLNIYVGNLSFETSESDLQAAFAAYGAVSAARIATDRDTGRARGFGFVEMANQAEAQAAIAGLNGKDLHGRTLTVNEARPREQRGAGSRSGGYSGQSRW